MPSKSILVIDDDPAIREVTQLTLETFGGWEVTTAGSGQEGVAMAAAQHPDAILLDVMMPGMDGHMTLDQLRSRVETESIPVILLTAKVLPADQRAFAAWGVAGLVAKPFDPVSLSSQVAECLGWK